jgi:hypothetical protein
VHSVREFFDLFRIDHVLGFYRIYGFPWRPERNEEFLHLTSEEAERGLEAPIRAFSRVRTGRQRKKRRTVATAKSISAWSSRRRGKAPSWRRPG